jgi:hypothetical protein
MQPLSWMYSYQRSGTASLPSVEYELVAAGMTIKPVHDALAFVAVVVPWL